MREDNRVERVSEYLYEMCEDEVFETAQNLEFAWAYVYEGLECLFRDYFGSDLASIIDAFKESDASADNWASYVIDEYDDIVEASDVEIDYDAVAERIVERYDDGTLGRYIDVSEYEGLEDILKDDGSYEWQDVMDALGGKENDLMREAIDEVKGFDDSEHINDFLELAKRTYMAWRVVEHFDKTHFCGIDESKYGEIIEYFENGSTAFALMVEEIIGNAVNGITIEKATEMFVKKHWM